MKLICEEMRLLSMPKWAVKMCAIRYYYTENGFFCSEIDDWINIRERYIAWLDSIVEDRIKQFYEHIDALRLELSDEAIDCEINSIKSKAQIHTDDLLSFDELHFKIINDGD